MLTTVLIIILILILLGAFPVLALQPGLGLRARRAWSD